MYLKRLELLGFKSFPDKTVVKLTSGVTAVVGPNGCGKSNILDAIRWVLGEQKVSLLRGNKMEEIIFNGTRDLKPLGMSEVTLVIQNTKGRLPTEYSEVQITRRLFRSGESEYLLNKVPCRLKDITDLLLDTGVGAHAYSMIQQDMVDAILSDRTDDRRFLFEEAAGISKYKNRKKAAIRKLETTDNDLLRLKDIVAEVNTQVNSLKRQVNKARRYKEYSDELRGWEIYLGKHAIDSFNQERREILINRDSLSDQRLKFDTDIDALSSDQERERKSLTDLDRELSDVSNQIYEKSEAAHTIEKDISILREKKENARSIKEKNTLDIDALAKRKVILQEQIGEVQEELTLLEGELSKIENDVADSRRISSEIDNKVLEARQKRENLNNRLMAIESQLSAGKSDDTNLKEQESEINSRLEEIEAQLNDCRRAGEEIAGKQKDLHDKQDEKQEAINQHKERQSELESKLKEHNERLEELSGKIFDLSASLEAAEARRHLLSEMVAHYEGFSSGVIAVFEDRAKWPDIIGAVADKLKPLAGYEEAIEAALGELAGYIICRDRNTAESIIQYLKSGKKGRAGFIILDEAREYAGSTRPDITQSGFLGWADDYVEKSDELSALTKVLLSHIAIVQPDTTEAIRGQLPPHFMAVTTDGRLLHSRSIISGGSGDELSLLGRKEKIEIQEKIIAELSSEIDNLKSEKNQVTSEIGTVQATLRDVNSEYETLSEEFENIKKEITAAGYEASSVTGDISRLENEQKKLNEKLGALRGRQYDLNLNYDQLIKERDELKLSLSSQDKEISELEAAADEAEKKFSDVQINQVEQKSKKQQLESKINHINELIADIEFNSEAKSNEIITARDEAEKAGEKIIILEKELKSSFDERTGIETKQTQMRDRRETIQQSIDAREKEIKSLRQNREETSSRLHEIEIRLTEIDSEIKTLNERLREEDIDLSQVESDIPDASVPEDKRYEHMRQLKESIRNMGAVNLLALEEYRTASERQEFLAAQLNDLTNAKSTLQSTITKINATARKLFLDTFDEVRGNFQRVFEELFTGGEADIRLTNPDDPLESPIEIIARPRGKKLLSITQMSGGERALTAISLLFAIYLTKPSPFCILDEVDAPLDDANIHRFLKLIKTFSDETQFINYHP